MQKVINLIFIWFLISTLPAMSQSANKKENSDSLHIARNIHYDSAKTNTLQNKDSIPIIWNNISFLNAANFDFSNNLSGTYLGKLNIFAPDINSSPFGFNAGVMRIKFNYRDTSNSPVYRENRLISPLDTIKQGAKYLRELNQYTTTLSNTVWSFYIQPMFRIASWPWPKATKAKGVKKFRSNSILPNGIYFHLYAELFVNKVNITTNITNIKSDTSLMDTAKRLSYIAYQKNPLLSDKTYINGYFGAGVTFNLDPFGNGNSRFFFQFTIGKTTNTPNWTSEDISTANFVVGPTRGGTTIVQRTAAKDSSWFYLVRAEFAQVLSDNSEIVIGTDIRGLFPKFSPLYASYIGLNINLNALAKIVSDKK